jgi:hypothetical protein
MKSAKRLGLAVILGALAIPVAAEDAFDACEVFTAKDAESVLGATAQEATAFKGKRPKVVPECKYTAAKDGRNLAASAQFKVARTEAEARQAFGDARMELQTKPLTVAGQEAFWSAKVGQLHLRKGRAWLTVAVGPEKPADRDMETARKLAETLAKKM